jgi:serine phosphatase RsbU (regulator of sigma subunit)
MKRYLLLFAYFLCHCIYSQNIDSIKKVFQNNQVIDTTKFNTAQNLFSYYLKAKKFNEADVYAKACEEIARKLKRDTLVADSKSLQSDLLVEIGEYAKAIEINLEALTYYKKYNVKRKIAAILNNTGRVYFILEKNKEALNYFNESLNIETDDKKRTDCLLNIGVIYAVENDYSKAESYFLQVQKKYEKSKDSASIAYVLNNLGLLTLEHGNYKKAKEYLTSAYQIKMRLRNKDEMHNANYTMADLYFRMKEYEKSKYYIDQETNYIDTNIKNYTLYEHYDLLLKYYAAIKDYKNAYLYLEKKTVLKEQLYDDEKLNEIKNNELKRDFLNKIIADSISSATKEKMQAIQISEQAAKINEARTLRYTLIGGILFALITGFFMFRKYKETKTQNGVIESQNKLLAKKNKETEDSLIYASRLQSGILPKIQELKHDFSDAFILYKPKDIVSGDFYWTYKKGNDIFIAVADCTGHGVPGAMMSFLSFNNLERCVKELGLDKPSAILETLSDLIEKSFQSNEKSIRDGLDICLLKYNKLSKVLSFSGANSNLYLVGDGEVKKINGTRRSIGYSEFKHPFAEIEIQLRSDNCIFLNTDGYADQIGGPMGKKYLSKNLSQLYLTLADKSSEEQLNTLENQFNLWKGSLEQIDDVTVIGLSI